MKYFPQNWFGECGLVALSMLLGYYDTFYNSEFITDGLTYQARIYSPKSRSSSSDWVFDRYETQTLEYSVQIPYRDINGGFYPVSKWNDVPGTNYALRDFCLINTCIQFLE